MAVQSSRYTWVQLSDIGKRKPSNEDFVDHFIPENAEDEARSGALFIVADGVGGSAFGEKASEYTARKVLFEYYQSDLEDPGQRLQKGIVRANSDIYAHSQEIAVDLMGTTVVAAAIRGNELVVANVGDSRAYLIRGRQIKQITRDHSLVQQMLDDHQLTEDEARTFKKKNVILRSVGAEESVEVDLFTVDLIEGDILLLCSDGLHKYFPESSEMAEIVQGEEISAAANRLLKLANNRGGSDNISIILVQIGERSVSQERKPRKGTLYDPDQTDIPSKARKPSKLWISVGLGLIFIIAIFAAGFLWLQSQGNPQVVSTPYPPTQTLPTVCSTQIPVVPLSTVTRVPEEPAPTATVELPGAIQVDE